MSTGLYSGSFGLSFGTGLYKTRLGLFSSASGLITGSGQGAALSLDFLSGNTLDPRVTFSRGTNATLIDSTGQLTYAPSNQIPNSESFTAATWVKVGLDATTPVVSNTVVAPDGTTTADSIVEDTASSTHRIDYSGLAGNAGKYAASVYLKAGTRTFARLQFDAVLNAVTSSCGVQINLSDGTPSSTTVAGNITAATATSENVGNGWYRLGLIFTISPTYVLSSGSVRIYLMQSLSPTPTYTGNGSNIFVWGAQFGAMTYETALRAYNSTTPKNLLGFTEEFNNAAWTKANSTITTNAIADPNGYLNADKLVEDTASTEHFVDQPFTAISATTYTYSAYAKAGERDQIVLRFAVGTVFVGGSVQVGFTLTGSGSSFAISGSPTGSSITAVGNGWYRCRISVLTVPAVAATPSVRIQLYDGTSSNYTGNGTSGAYIWGAQLSDSASVDPYVYNPAAALTSTAYYGPRFDYDPNYVYSTNNLIPYANPQDFSNASFWTKARATAPATTATADPAETYTAYKLTENVSVISETHVIQWQGVNTAVTAGVEYTFSGYAKAAERTAILAALGPDNGAFTTNGGTIDITPSSSGGTGAVSGVTGAAPIVTDAGNGWWRWSITATATASALCILRIQLIAGGTNSYVGDGISGAYIWGAQLTTSSAAVPFFYYPSTPLGLLIEEARTNLTLYSDQLDVSATWTQSLTSVTANATTSPDGTTNADRLTADGSSNPHDLRQTVTFTAAAQTVSVYAKKDTNSFVQLRFGAAAIAAGTGFANFDLNAGTIGTIGAGLSAASITPTGNGWYRCTITGTTAAVSSFFSFYIVTSATAVSAEVNTLTTSVFLYGVQLEAGGFATSYIPTVSASATRSADVATMVGNNFTNWYNQTAGTISASVDTVASSSITAPVLSFQDAAGSATSRHQIATYTTCSATVLLGATQSNIGVNTLSSPKLAYAYQDNNFAFSANGTTTIVDTTGTVPLNIGYATLGKWDFGSASSLNGHIKIISYYNTRLSNNQVRALTE